MRLYRVLMSVRVSGGSEPFEYDYTRSLDAFYVQAVSPGDAMTRAIRLGCGAASPRDQFRSSGTVIECDSNLDPIEASGCVRSWDDGTCVPTL